MSARDQARRDGEFDRLLACCDTLREEDHARQAYEMGKRHGREMDQEERRGSTKPPADEVKP